MSIVEEKYSRSINARTEQVWICNLMRELGFPRLELTLVYCDNQSAIQVAHNHVAQSKMKHVEPHVHYLKQLVHENVVTIVC